MTYDPLSIVIVPFPFTDKLQTKRRPALVLSHKLHQQKTNHITLLMITSAINSDWDSDHEIQDLTPTGLTSASIVRQKIFTIDSRLILERLGNLSDHDEAAVKKCLAMHLACLGVTGPHKGRGSDAQHAKLL